MPIEKINVTKMFKMVNEGYSQVEIAQHFGVSPAAVCKKLKEVRGKSTRVSVSKKIDKVTNNQIDAMQQLADINRKTHDMLDKVEDQPMVAVKLISEIRAQLKLQLDIFETLFNLEAANDFMNAVMDTLEEVDPDVRDRVIYKLNKKSALRSAIKFG